MSHALAGLRPRFRWLGQVKRIYHMECRLCGSGQADLHRLMVIVIRSVPKMGRIPIGIQLVDTTDQPRLPPLLIRNNKQL